MKAKWLYAMAAVAFMAVQAGAGPIDFYTLSPVGMDIGNPAGGDPQAGSDSYAAGTFTINAYGSDWWDGGECAHIMYVAAPVGNWRIETTVSLTSPADGWTKAGVFVRDNLLCGGNPLDQQINAVMAQTNSNGSAFQYRTTIGAGMTNISGSPDTTKVALQEYNGTVTGYYWDGSTLAWVVKGQVNLNLTGSPYYIGLMLSSHNNGTPSTATYSNTVLTDAVVPPPPPSQSPIADVRAGGWHTMGIREAVDYPDGSQPDNIGQAVSVLNSGLTNDYQYDAPVLNILDSGGNGNFGNDSPFGVVTNGWRSLGNVDHLALVASGTVRITSAGWYTFDVNSDDGFELGIDGVVVGNYTTGRGAGDTLMLVNLTAGDHAFQLIYWEGGGGSEVEFSAAAGLKSGFDGDFRLVGDTANGGLELVPEPATLTLLGLGGLAMLLRRRR